MLGLLLYIACIISPFYTIGMKHISKNQRASYRALTGLVNDEPSLSPADLYEKAVFAIDKVMFPVYLPFSIATLPLLITYDIQKPHHGEQ